MGRRNRKIAPSRPPVRFKLMILIENPSLLKKLCAIEFIAQKEITPGLQRSPIFLTSLTNPALVILVSPDGAIDALAMGSTF